MAFCCIDKLKILQLLSVKPMTLSELSRALDLAVSTVSFHVDSLVKAQLIFISYEPGVKGHVKLCTKATHNLYIDFDMVTNSETKILNSRESIEMPIGNFVDCNIQSPCGIAGKTEQLIENLRGIDGLVVAALIKRTNSPGIFKISLRSKDPQISVGRVARRLNGGGHEMAAGGTIFAKSVEDAEEILLKHIEQEFNHETQPQ